MANGGITAVRKDNVVWLTIDQPPLNLLTPALIEDLRREVDRLNQDDTIRALVLSGSGKHTTAGMQIEALRDLDEDSARSFISGLRDAIQTVYDAPFPTIAMLNGACLGGGLELVLACDLRIAANDLRLGLPEVRVGIPSVIHAALLASFAGPGRAAQMLLMGESIDASEALQWGLVNAIVEPSLLRQTTEEWLTRLLRSGPQTLRLQKELIKLWRDVDQRSAIDLSVDVFARAYRTSEPYESMQAFLEKREPRFDAG